MKRNPKTGASNFYTFARDYLHSYLVGAENTDTSCDLQILVYQATEAVSSS